MKFVAGHSTSGRVAQQKLISIEAITDHTSLVYSLAVQRKLHQTLLITDHTTAALVITVSAFP